jgi:hypothetical protein
MADHATSSVKNAAIFNNCLRLWSRQLKIAIDLDAPSRCASKHSNQGLTQTWGEKRRWKGWQDKGALLPRITGHLISVRRTEPEHTS